MNLKVIVSAVILSGGLTIGLMGATSDGSKKPERSIKVKYLNDHQIYLSCKEGMMANMQSVSGSLVISCDPGTVMDFHYEAPKKPQTLDDHSKSGAD